MAGNKTGALKAAASRIGVSVEEYAVQLAAGRKWCMICRTFLEVARFGRDTTRGDGLASGCRDCKNAQARARYLPVPEPHASTRGRRYVAPRDGDRKQARARVNHLVENGTIPRPADLPCFDCGDTERPRHEYDHYLGYAAEHHEDVQAVCVPCHRKREKSRNV